MGTNAMKSCERIIKKIIVARDTKPDGKLRFVEEGFISYCWRVTPGLRRRHAAFTNAITRTSTSMADKDTENENEKVNDTKIIEEAQYD